MQVLSNIKFNTDTLRFVYTSFKRLRFIKKNVDTYALSMLMTRYTSKKSSCYELVVILHQYKKVSLNVWILRLVKIMQITSHRDVIAAFKARWLFLVINVEILCNFFKEYARLMLLKILTHSIAGSVTFCFDGCFVKWFKHVSSAIIRF